MAKIIRYAMKYDRQANCYCDIEESNSGTYVDFSDYMSLLREYADYKEHVNSVVDRYLMHCRDGGKTPQNIIKQLKGRY